MCFMTEEEDLVVTIIIWTVEHQSHDEGSQSLDLSSRCLASSGVS